jgi:hypothetical protein
MVQQLTRISKTDSLSPSTISINLLLSILIISFTGCDDHPSTATEPDLSEEDRGVGGSEEPAGNLGDAEVQLSDINVGGDPTNGMCVWHDDCSDQEQCLNQECVATSQSCQFSQSCPLGEVCYEGRCVEPCLTDLHCPEDGHCMNGSCLPLPDDLRTEVTPNFLGSSDQLWVGVGTAPLIYPIGVSAAGYGGRAGPRTPYNQSLGGSDSVIDRQDVRVIIIDNGDTLSILTRLPLSWSTDYLRTLIAKEVSVLTQSESLQDGIDILDHLVIFATHSHSQPGRFWNLVPTLPFGTFGFGTFSSSITKGYARSAAQAIVEALENREPSRLGWHLLDVSDPDRRIHSNRRNTNDQFDDRMLAFRVDDMNGIPKAALVGYGIHGTHLMTPLISGDAAAGIEQVLTEKLTAKHGRFIPLIFANGNAGNISPRGDHLTDQSLGHLQTLGELLWNVYDPVFSMIETESNLTLKQQITRVELGYEQLGYDTADQLFAGRDGLYKYGAFQCVQTEKVQGEEPYSLETSSCLMDLQRIVHEPIVQFQKTVVSVIQIGELFITTLPGEPASGLGLGLADAIELLATESGLNSARSFNFGYAQDHQFYLLEPEDWFMGGYEASMSTWGPFVGRYLAESALLTAQRLIQGEANPASSLKPTWWPNIDDDLRLVPENAPNEPSWITQAPSEIKRGDLINIEWVGGDPAVDLPRITLMDIDSNLPALHPLSLLPFDDSGFESIITYLGDYDSDQRWVSQWDLPFNLPPGQYRFKVEGNIGTNRMPYSLSSSTFEVSGIDGLVTHEISRQETEIKIKLTYPNAPSTDDGNAPFDTLEPIGSLLHLREGDLDLSEPSRALKPYRFILGAPVNGELTIKIWSDESPITTPREPEIMVNIIPESSTCDVQLITSRDLDGDVSSEVIANVPCSQVIYTLAEEDIDQSLWISINDRSDNQTPLMQIEP